MSDRQFCAKCAGHMMTGHPALGITDVRVSIMPSLAFTPTIHLHYAETVFPMRDGLLKLKGFLLLSVAPVRPSRNSLTACQSRQDGLG